MIIFREYAEIIVQLWVSFSPEEYYFLIVFPTKRKKTKVQTSSALELGEDRARSLCLQGFLGFPVTDGVK